MIFEIDKKPKEQLAVICDDGEKITYGQMVDEIHRIQQLVSEKQCLVFCLCKNTKEALLGYLAFLDMGTVPLLLDSEMNADELNRLIQIYNPSYLWRPKGSEEGKDYELVCLSAHHTPMNELLALLLTTSGSTGSPKLVRLSRQNLEENAASIAEYLHLSNEERPITSLPMYYTYGLSVINSHLLVGACILLTEKSVLEPEFWQFADTYAATGMSGVPYTYEMLNRLRFLRGEMGQSIRTFTQAGGALSESLQKDYAEFCKAKGKEFVVMYGQTEATARMSYLPPEYCGEKIGSIGIPIPGGRFELISEDGSIITECNVTGELVYSGGNVSLGYACSKEDLLSGDEQKGVLHTGDLAYRDKAGFYFIKGRKKRFVKLRGNRVGLDECEFLLRQHYGNQGKEAPEFVCDGVDDFICVYRTDTTITDADMVLAELLQMDYHLFGEKWIPEIPHLSNGKIDYEAIRHPFPFRLKKDEKRIKFAKQMLELTDYHKKNCSKYKRIMDTVELPFLPTGIFKEVELNSLDEQKNYRLATSSGTSERKSKIVIDSETASLQQQALANIVMDFIGPLRLPMLVIDCADTAQYSQQYTARTAGIMGFSMFGRNRTFALDENLKLNTEAVERFLNQYGEEKFLIFGFTYLVWESLCEQVAKQNLSWDFSNGILIHGGGWKKMENLNISKEVFRDRLANSVGLTDIHDYYGMAEQAGSIFMECNYGHLHVSDYSDVIVRNAFDFSECEAGQKGILQVCSILPRSYPGHNLLTEDEGVLLGVDDCPCGRYGKYFQVLGRVKHAELRGCSDMREIDVT